MASRQEEKQRRREERLAAERAAAAAHARRQRLQWTGGGVIALAIVAGLAVLLLAGLGGSKGNVGQAAQPTANGISLPPQRTSDQFAAAKAARCTLKQEPIEGRLHKLKKFTEADYKTNPPTSGDHYPQWYQDGVYLPGDTPNLGMLVHTLEHGRIDVQYRPGTAKHAVDQLEALLASESNGYHMLLYQNTTSMPYQVAATAWGHLLGCPTMSPKVFDAIRTFRDHYIDQAPEHIP
jgi:Protein of unknown function (DUF3105)